jgi:hypothetical protein
MSFTRSSAKPGGRPQVLGHPCGYGGMRVALEAGVGAHRQLLPTCDREIKEASLLPSLIHIIYCEAKKCTLFLGSMLDKYEAAMEKVIPILRCSRILVLLKMMVDFKDMQYLQ